MAAFEPTDLMRLLNRLDAMRANIIAHNDATFELTYDDALHMMVEANDRDLMTEAAKLLHKDFEKYNDGFTIALGHRGRDLHVTVNGYDYCRPPFLPAAYPNLPATYPNQCIMPDYARIAALDVWMDREIDIRKEFAIARFTLMELNEMCSKPQQVAFFWPMARSLAQGRHETEHLVQQLTPSRATPQVPALRGWVRKGIESATETLATALLMPPISRNAMVHCRVGNFEFDFAGERFET